MQTLKVFIGYDHRQPVAYNALSQSILALSTKPVSITPLVINQLPIKRTGLTPFTFSRFLVPWLCNYKGWGLFLDIDIILNHDISELFKLADDRYSVFVSKNVKRFEWASVMLFNNEKCQVLTPEYIETAENLHGIAWCKDWEIGSLPPEWNHLVGYDKPRDDAKLIHFTQGIPAFPETSDCEHADTWREAHLSSISATSWNDLMGSSVHSAGITGGEDSEVNIKIPRYYLSENGEIILPQYREKVGKMLDDAAKERKAA